jgi:hypothetical protein
MSAPETPAPRPAPKFSGGQIAMIIVGLILLLPGVCSLVFVAGMASEIRLHDPIAQMIMVLWAICFAVSAVGILLIVLARKRRARGLP